MNKWFYLMVGSYIFVKLIIILIKTRAFSIRSEYSDELSADEAWIACITFLALIITIIAIFSFWDI